MRWATKETLALSDFAWGLLTSIAGNNLAAPENIPDLDEAVSCADLAAKYTPHNHRDWTMRVATWGDLLNARFERARDPADLDKTIGIYRRVVEMPLPQGLTDWYMVRLGEALMERYQLAHRGEDLREAIDRLRHGEAGTQRQDLAGIRGTVLSTLGAALRSSFERGEDPADLNAAIDAGREALRIATSDSQRAGRQSNLANDLRRRYEITTEIDDLNESVTHLRAAVDTARDDQVDTARYLVNLGVTLLVRYEAAGQLADLDEARLAAARALEYTPADHPQYAGRLQNGARVMSQLYEFGGGPEHLSAATSWARRAVQASRRDDPAYSGRVALLLNLVMKRTADVDVNELDGAIDLAEEALRRLGDARASDLAGTLASALFQRHRLTRTPADFDAASALAQQTLTATAVDTHIHAATLHNLAHAYSERFRADGASSDADQAIDFARRAATSPAGSPQLKLMAAHLWARRAADRGRVKDSVDGYRVAVDALTRLAMRGLGRVR